ncbi:MAG: 16S rRNA (cytidine(1402)-2'-O)-methyltransferase [Magnetococcales bacterium]|nr:16S rRNA (cytidine(1402)-2'-O)-methyltransferase [Magnetococcales bacterium]
MDKSLIEFGVETKIPTGRLYIVPTPIGNLEDMTYRAVATLQQVDRILAEDTRHTRRLCHHFEIDTPLRSFTDHNAPRRLPEALAELEAGKQLALASDAGMPGVSDPGIPLVRACIEAGVEVEVLPGASALLPALVGSGLSEDGSFLFGGFLPRKSGQRQKRFTHLAGCGITMLFFESPRRIIAALNDLATALGPERKVVVARELTKIYESFHRGTALTLVEWFKQHSPRGEMVLVVEGGSMALPELDAGAIKRLINQVIDQGGRPREMARKLATAANLSRSEAYAMIQDRRDAQQEN